MLSLMAGNARLLADGSLMLQAAQPCSRESSDIFARTQSTPSTRSGRGSAALKNGTATNGANDFPITRTLVAPRANGPRIIFSGRGRWVWIIPLQGGDVSAGIVYDSRIFKFPHKPTLGQRLHAHILNNPVGREIFGTAKVIEGDVHAFSMLPYHSEKVCGDGWAMVGDAAGFIDPLYSPGLDFCSYTSYYVADLLARSLRGDDVAKRLSHYNQQYPITYRYWFESLFKNKYYYIGRRGPDVGSAAS